MAQGRAALGVSDGEGDADDETGVSNRVTVLPTGSTVPAVGEEPSTRRLPEHPVGRFG